jgi:cell division protein FtsL
MAAAAAIHGNVPSARRRSCWTGTPEIYFAKSIDNSRLVKVDDTRRGREMRHFAVALGCLFLLVMTFAWQHYKAIEYGYKIEALKVQCDGISEVNHALRLEDASLRDPSRIDNWARQHGLQPPQAGQVIRMDSVLPDSGSPIMASAAPIRVISTQ